MTTRKLSRRRLLGGLLTVLTGYLGLRSRRAAAASRRQPTTTLRWTRGPWPITTYFYDGSGRLYRAEDQPPRPLETRPCTAINHQQRQFVTYYDYAQEPMPSDPLA